MATRKSSLTTYDRATPAQRAKIRQFAMAQPCPDCGAIIGQRCQGSGGNPAQPHWRRRREAMEDLENQKRARKTARMLREINSLTA